MTFSGNFSDSDLKGWKEHFTEVKGGPRGMVIYKKQMTALLARLEAGEAAIEHLISIIKSHGEDEIDGWEIGVAGMSIEAWRKSKGE